MVQIESRTTSLRKSIQNVQNSFQRPAKWNKTIVLKIVQYLWNRIKSLEMCSPRWFSRRGNHAPIWSSIVGNSVSSKRDNVLRSWPTRGFERVRLRKGHSKCYWNHAIFLRRTFTLIVIRCLFDTSDMYIYTYISAELERTMDISVLSCLLVLPRFCFIVIWTCWISI